MTIRITHVVKFQVRDEQVIGFIDDDNRLWLDSHIPEGAYNAIKDRAVTKLQTGESKLFEDFHQRSTVQSVEFTPVTSKLTLPE